LSKSQDSALSGRVLLMLASALPLDEASGFNQNGKYASQDNSSTLNRVGAGAVAAVAPPITAGKEDGKDGTITMDIDEAKPASQYVATPIVTDQDAERDAVDFADVLDVAFPTGASAEDSTATAASPAVARAKSFFTTLWSLQPFFSDPNQLKNAAAMDSYITGPRIA
jgi:hypothetical protein